LNIAHGLHDGGGDECKIANAVAAYDGVVNAESVGGVVTELAENGQNAAPEKTAAVEGDILLVDSARERGETLGQIAAEIEELEFFCSLFAAANLAQIIHLAAHRCLPEVLGVGEKRKMAFAEKCGNNSANQQQQQKRRVADEHCGKSDGRDGLLDQTAHLLDHDKTIGGLNAGALQTIVEDGILVGRDIEACRFLHDLDADMIGIPVGKQIVEVIDRAREDADYDGKSHLRSDEPPEVDGQRLMLANAVDAIDDESADNADADGQKRHNNADGDVPEDYRGARFPDEVQNRGNISEGAHTVCPCACFFARLLRSAGSGFTNNLLIWDFALHRSLYPPYRI
jgi:hypothetical protein